MNQRTPEPRAILDFLLTRIGAIDSTLLASIRDAIDAGKDVELEDSSIRSRKMTRRYRKHVAYSDREAVQVAVKALEAYFVELPMIINSISETFAKAGIEGPRERSYFKDARSRETSGVGAEKTIVLELQAETQITRNEIDSIVLTRFSTDEIEAQAQALSRFTAAVGT